MDTTNITIPRLVDGSYFFSKLNYIRYHDPDSINPESYWEGKIIDYIDDDNIYVLSMRWFDNQLPPNQPKKISKNDIFGFYNFYTPYVKIKDSL